MVSYDEVLAVRSTTVSCYHVCVLLIIENKNFIFNFSIS